jgi:xanthine dehydrogenase small subunit
LILNGRRLDVEGISPTTTLLRYLRDRAHLMGTKEGCAEGDCGACTVAVLEQTPSGPSWRGVNSCLVLLPMMHGKTVLTVEGIGDARNPHLVQDALARELGSQCGYCTPGVVMSLFEACYREDFDEGWKIDAQMCGNLCRCTGYRPIRDTAKQVAGARPRGPFLEELAKPLSPAEGLAYSAGDQRFFLPATLDELFELVEHNPGARFVAGGTDLGLEVTKRFARPPLLISLEGLPGLKVLEAKPDRFRFGAGANLTDLEAMCRFSLPPLERMLRYFGSRQIKNRATIGGNLCTASPIGDLAPVFLSLGAELVLLSKGSERRVPIDQFFLSYRKTALAPDELLGFVEIPRPAPGAKIVAYKVSKRRELDISTVASSFYVQLDAEGRVLEARLAYGGMAATPARARKCEAALSGQPWTLETVRSAIDQLDADFSPISDHRGSAWYRMRLAKNLLLGFWQETQHTAQPRLVHRHTGTVQEGTTQ